MNAASIDCLINVHFGETEKQPTWMLKVRDDYFKGPESMFAPVDLTELLDEMDEQGVRKAVLMDNLAKPSVTARKFVEAKPERFALAMGGVNLLRPMPSLRELSAVVNDLPVVYAAVGPSFWGDGQYPPKRRGLLSALHQMRRAWATAVHQHRHSRTADPRRGAEPHAPRPGLRALPRTEAVHDSRRGSLVGHRDPITHQVRQPAPDDIGVVAEAATGKPAALHADSRKQTK